MRALFLALVLAVAATTVAATGCHSVVRDGNTYKQELRFLQEGGTRVAASNLSVAADRAKAGDASGCVALATDALVVSRRFPWHVAKALHLAGLGDDPGNPPAVPFAAIWCISQKAGGTP